MHIVLLNDDALPKARGGAAVIVDHLRKVFSAAGHRVTLITTHQDSNDEIRMDDATGTTISIPVQYNLKKRHRMCVRNPAVSSHIERLFTELKPDVVHAHNLHTYLTYESLKIAKKYTNQIVLTAHDTFLVSFDRVRGTAYENAALKSKGYRMHWWNHLCAGGRKYWPLRNGSIKKIIQASETKVAAISHATEQFLTANHIPVQSVIPNGLASDGEPTQEDVDAFRNRMNLTGPTILFAGRIRKDKGIHALLGMMEHILNTVPNAQLLVAGEKERLPQVSDGVRDAVIATGWITPEEMRTAYAACDVVATPSLYLDNFPTVNLEAALAGKPVVGTCFGGTPEVVIEGETGFIRNPHEKEAFAEAIITLLQNADEARRMGSAGRKRIEDAFSLQKQVDGYLALFAVSS